MTNHTHTPGGACVCEANDMNYIIRVRVAGSVHHWTVLSTLSRT